MQVGRRAAIERNVAPEKQGTERFVSFTQRFQSGFTPHFSNVKSGQNSELVKQNQVPPAKTSQQLKVTIFFVKDCSTDAGRKTKAMCIGGGRGGGVRNKQFIKFLDRRRIFAFLIQIPFFDCPLIILCADRHQDVTFRGAAVRSNHTPVTRHEEPIQTQVQPNNN